MLKRNRVHDFAETQRYTPGFHYNLQFDEIPDGAATGDSYNFFLDSDGKWTTRPGSQYIGTPDSDAGGCTSSLILLRRDGVKIPVKFYTTATEVKAKYFHPTKLTWELLEDGYAVDSIFGGDVMEKTTDNLNHLIFCNEVDDYTVWNGATGVVDSVTAATIVLSGTTTLANLGFTATGDLEVAGQKFNYTGVAAQTFTGVTPDPSAAGIVAGDAVTQFPVAYSALPLGNVIIAYQGRIVMNAKPTTSLYGGGSYVGSVLNEYDDFTFSTPRDPTEGYQLVMSEGGGSITGMAHYEGGVAILKESAVNKHQVTLDENDFPTQQPLIPYDASASGTVGLINNKLKCVLGNQVFFVSPRNIINSLQRVARIDTPQALPLSDRVQKLLNTFTFDDDCGSTAMDTMAYFSGKTSSNKTEPDVLMTYNQRFDAWNTPWKGLGLSSFFVYNNAVCGTMASTPDVVRLGIGTQDYATPTELGIPIDAKLVLKRKNYGKKGSVKESRVVYVEGWMAINGSATFTMQFDEAGRSFSGTLSGDESGYFFQPNTSGSFGSAGFGVNTFGGAWIFSPEMPDGVGKFRIILSYKETSFFAEQFIIETSTYFKLLTDGTDSEGSAVTQPVSTRKSMGQN